MGSPTTLGVLLYAIGAATAQPTGLFSDASACGKVSKTCDGLASARAVYVHESDQSRDAAEKPSDSECSVCLDAAATHVYVPCGHLATCAACAEALMASTKQCPICRATVTHALQPYRV